MSYEKEVADILSNVMKQRDEIVSLESQVATLTEERDWLRKRVEWYAANRTQPAPQPQEGD